MSERTPKAFDDIPAPVDPQQAELAVKLGMIVLQGMRDVLTMEKFTGEEVPAVFRSEISDASGMQWLLTVSRNPGAIHA